MSERQPAAEMPRSDAPGDDPSAPAAAPPQDQAAAESTEAETVLPEDLPAKVEAALLTADRALTAARLGEALGGVPGKALKQTIAQLNEAYEKTGRSFRIEQVAGGWQVMTLPAYADVLSALNKTRSQSRLSPAALETLAIVAYKQPILRAQVESIRGVACGEVLRSLMDRHLVKIVGRAEEIGRPMLYGTTKTFLELFGLATLADLPKVEQLQFASEASENNA